MTPPSLDGRAEQLLRELAPSVLGAVIRRHGDFAFAEDAVQEALIAAAAQWPREGLPDNPRGWLIRVASRRRIDQQRSELAAGAAKPSRPRSSTSWRRRPTSTGRRIRTTRSSCSSCAVIPR